MKPEEVQRQFIAGELILERGSCIRELYVVAAGTVQLEREGSDVFRLLGPGELFGEVSAIRGMPSPYAARAAEEVTVVVVELPLLNRLCAENSEFCVRLIQHLTAELCHPFVARAASTGSCEQPSKPASVAVSAEPLAKLARAILGAAVGTEVPSAVSGQLTDLAEIAELEMMVAFLALTNLLDRELVHIVNDQLTVLNRDELQAVCNAG